MRLSSRLVSLALVSLALAGTPAFAGQAENALLAAYEGDWIGVGKSTGVNSGDVSCRITFKASSAGKLSYNGRCSFEQGAAAFTGTMVYNDDANRYEAAASAQGISTRTVGKKQGSAIVFATAAMDTQYGKASSVMTLGGATIKMSFKLVGEDGETASSITFTKG